MVEIVSGPLTGKLVQPWNPITTVPQNARVLVFDPAMPSGREVFEATAKPDGTYHDPVYCEWDGTGATHWMPLPHPPR